MHKLETGYVFLDVPKPSTFRPLRMMLIHERIVFLDVRHVQDVPRLVLEDSLVAGEHTQQGTQAHPPGLVTRQHTVPERDRDWERG